MERRYSGRNHEVEVKIMKETLESALWCNENPRSNDGMIRKGKSWNWSATADQLEHPTGPIDEIFISQYEECCHVRRDCEAIVDTFQTKVTIGVPEYEICWCGTDVWFGFWMWDGPKHQYVSFFLNLCAAVEEQRCCEAIAF